jgi:hypothetical protein
MKRARSKFWLLPLVLALAAGGCSSSGNKPDVTLAVNSLEDSAAPPAGKVTLRSAIEAAGPGDRITFDSSLDGGTILLTAVGEEHSTLLGEVYVNNAFSGYQERDYGKSALYAHKNLSIDASNLPNGITVKWGGGEASHARVLAVSGDLTMKNVTISSGYSQAEAIAGGNQPYTLARGGGLAVWGTATLSGCTIAENAITGELAYFSGKPSAAGAGVGATTGNAHVIETVWLQNSIVVGNTLTRRRLLGDVHERAARQPRDGHRRTADQNVPHGERRSARERAPAGDDGRHRRDRALGSPREGDRSTGTLSGNVFPPEQQFPA